MLLRYILIKEIGLSYSEWRVIPQKVAVELGLIHTLMKEREKMQNDLAAKSLRK